MKKRPVNLERTDENIADQYPDIFDGLQKDAIQNAWDAKLTKKGRDWKLIFKYEPVHNTLIIEDFGTTGMNEEKWERYQGLWHTDKIEDYEAAGSRGQGKFLFHYFSKEKLVLTETIDEKGIYRFSYGTTQEYDDEEKTLSDFIPGAPKLDHQGTKIWIFNIKDDFKKELLDIEKFSGLIAASWWEIIKNYNATIVVDFDGSEKIVSNSTLFSIKSKKEKNYQNEEIKKLGKIRNLVIRYLNEEIPPLFQGIAIQRAGMTILRIPVRADETIKKRTCGYCNFDEQIESELKKCELPNHMGFTAKRAWAYVREFVEYKLESFILELSPKKEKINADQKVLDEAVKLINKLVYEYAPELSEGEPAPGGRKRPPGPSTPPKPKRPIRIDRFAPNERKIEYGESLITDCGIVNETSNKEILSLAVKIYHAKTENKKYAEKFNFELLASSRKTINIPLLDFDKKTDKAGKYIGEAILKSQKTSEEIDNKRFIFYVHEDPPKGKAFISKFELHLGRGLFFERWRNLPRNEKGVVGVIWDNPEFVRLREQAKSKKVSGKEQILYCTKCGADEAMRRLLEIRYNEKKLTSDELKEIKRIHDELIYGANISIF